MLDRGRGLTDARRVLPSLSEWQAQGRQVTVHGRRVFVVERGQPDRPAVVILHGYPTSSHDWSRVLVQLSASYRIVVHDHLGFGLSEKPTDYSYSLVEQAEIAVGLWRQLGIDRAHLIAHDYGTSVATEILARAERQPWGITFESLTLSNGSVHIELAKPRLIQHLLANPTLGPTVAQLASFSTLKRNFTRIIATKGALEDHDLRTIWELIEREDGRARLPQISRYLDERRKFWHRWIGALTRLEFPTLVLWGDQDPVARNVIAEALAGEIPGARLQWLTGVGHYPMVEVPDRYGAAVLGFLGVKSTQPPDALRELGPR